MDIFFFQIYYLKDHQMFYLYFPIRWIETAFTSNVKCKLSIIKCVFINSNCNASFIISISVILKSFTSVSVQLKFQTFIANRNIFQSPVLVRERTYFILVFFTYFYLNLSINDQYHKNQSKYATLGKNVTSHLTRLNGPNEKCKGTHRHNIWMDWWMGLKHLFERISDAIDDDWIPSTITSNRISYSRKKNWIFRFIGWMGMVYTMCGEVETNWAFSTFGRLTLRYVGMHRSPYWTHNILLPCSINSLALVGFEKNVQ